ncbi:MAG: hypothetical protein FWF91_07625 [Coriobacteriia bacterium]|nr:hypothetical protein [Coriobacteriia bacterium]
MTKGTVPFVMPFVMCPFVTTPTPCHAPDTLSYCGAGWAVWREGDGRWARGGRAT